MVVTRDERIVGRSKTTLTRFTFPQKVTMAGELLDWGWDILDMMLGQILNELAGGQ